jgi:phage terminase small subunit
MTNKPGRKSAAELAVAMPTPISTMPSGKLVPAPAHLSDEVTAWWHSVVKDYELEPHHLRLLQSAAEAWDRMQQARQALADHGKLTFVSASGDLKTHPAVAIERDARVAFARLVRELDLDAGAPAERSRPPALHSNRRG